ncbi:MAG: hypothetical protein GF320_21085 [Armatimonadia bacterium]|nr:hypothetical protein [Armatimonadia bacterium]
MDQSTKMTKIFAVVLFVVVAMGSGALMLVMRSVQKNQEAGLRQENQELGTRLDEIETLISERGEWEGKASQFSQELARYNLVLQEDAPVPQDGFSYVHEDEYEPTFYRDLQKLAEYTGCTFDLWQLTAYAPRPTEERPENSGDDQASADPVQERKWSGDEAYLERLQTIRQVADIKKVDLRIRGHMQNIQMFIVGLSGFEVPTERGQPGWFFPELVVVSNISVRALDVEPEFYEDMPTDDPILEATLNCRYFPFQPLPTDAEADGVPALEPAETTTARHDDETESDAG